MTQKPLGYVELEWICPNCQRRNPGPRPKCESCGAAQPADVAFVQPLREKIIEDEQKIAAAAAGPDIHCGYCGARNQATATNCHQCGGDIKEGQARAAGQTLGAHRDQPVPNIKCPACGAESPGEARRCQRCGAGLVAGPELEGRTQQNKATAGNGKGGSRVALWFAAAALALIVLFLALLLRTEETIGVVNEVNWQTRIEIEALAPVTKSDWLERIPVGAEVGRCQQRVARTQDEPAPDAREVCGTPYTVDQGSGFGQVVQDCRYEILEEWCEYKVQEWRSIDSVTANGSGINATWPELRLSGDQRAGRRREEYIVRFTADGGDYLYTLSSAQQAARFEEGSRWILSVNTFDAVMGVEPVR
jgi:ribosomal protein L40E